MMYPRVAVGGIVQDELRRVLLLCRGPDSINGAGEWSVPGGKVDAEETLARASARELFEETGIIAEQMSDTGIYTQDIDWGPSLHFVTHYLTPLVWRGTARIMEPHKHSGLIWMPEDELTMLAHNPSDDFPLFPPTRRMVQTGILSQI